MKVFQFFEGNFKMLGDHLGLLPSHTQEQVLYRMSVCKDCMEAGACAHCGCSVPGKLYVNTSCNGGERFPDMMNHEEWEAYKSENSIQIKIDRS